MKRYLVWIALGCAGLLLLIQLVPYGRDHTNPPVTQAAVFQSLKPQPELDDVVETIQSGEMPPLKYKVMPNHSAARLSDGDKAALIAGFRQVYADQPPSIRQGGGG